VTSSQPESSAPAAAPAAVLDRALALVRFLRDHCPWDAAQTPRSLTRYLLEEAHETAEAAAAEDPGALRDELGDLLLNVAFQVVIAEERGWFTREQVVEGLEHKMRRRHPHLYGLGEREDWDTLKRRERDAPGGVLDGAAPSTDPLTRAYQVQDAVARVGFDWDDWRGAWEKVREETEEVRHAMESSGAAHQEEELGDLLFAMVNLVRLAGTHPVPALARANAKFVGRFNALEALAGERGVPLGEASLAELDLLWDEVKRRERSPAG
jgi:nucleoside triphosphate diphosphatase